MPRCFIRKLIPFREPGNDFPIPDEGWTLEDFEEFMGLVVHPFWAFLMMLQLKSCDNRNIRLTHKNKPIIVKTSTKPVYRHDIERHLRIREVGEAINVYEWLSQKTVDWWMNILLTMRGRLVFICLMSDEPLRNVTYSFRGVGVLSSHSYPWYLRAMTLFNGFKGVDCVSSWGFFGLFTVQRCITSDIIKAIKVTGLSLAIGDPLSPFMPLLRLQKSFF